MDSELYHFGVKGMKWGVRKKRQISGRLSTGRKLTRKRRNPKDMTEEELDIALKRLRKENEYKNLTKTNTDKVMSYLGGLPAEIFKQTIAQATAQYIVSPSAKAIGGYGTAKAKQGYNFVKSMIG